MTYHPKSDFMAVMMQRGFLADCTDYQGLDEALTKGVVPGYIGFDATAKSLHVGSLIQIMMLRWLQKTGHKPITLMGGGTTKVGDPSFRADERPLLTPAQIDDNISGIQKVFAKYISYDDGPTGALMLNNAEWLDSLNYLDFLRDIGVLIMKKIVYAISALAALFSTAAKADVSVSGSGSIAYTDAGGNTSSIMGGGVSFDLSTTTDAGVSITAASGISLDKDSVGNTSGSTGVTAITFGFANGSITIGDDIGVADGKGKVGELLTWADDNLRAVSNKTGITDDEGSGIAASTSIGDMSISLQYVWDGAGAGDVDGAATTSQGASLSMPLGDATLTLATASDDVAGVNMTETAGAVSLPIAGGSVSVGITSTGGDTASQKGESYSAKYSTDFNGVALALGYTGHDAGTAKGQETNVTLSTSLGGGASLWAEYGSTSGTIATATSANSNSVVAIGTSVSF
jgi:hypothetical protein